MDRHAENRERKARKARQGMRVRGRSVLTLQAVSTKRGAAARKAKGGRS